MKFYAYVAEMLEIGPSHKSKDVERHQHHILTKSRCDRKPFEQRVVYTQQHNSTLGMPPVAWSEGKHKDGTGAAGAVLQAIQP